MEDIKCNKCNKDMIHLGGDRWYCPDCETKVTKLKVTGPKFVKQEPYINDEGIWVPVQPYVLEGTASTYQMIISKVLFVEAYNKWIKENE